MPEKLHQETARGWWWRWNQIKESDCNIWLWIWKGWEYTGGKKALSMWKLQKNLMSICSWGMGCTWFPGHRKATTVQAVVYPTQSSSVQIIYADTCSSTCWPGSKTVHDQWCGIQQQYTSIKWAVDWRKVTWDKAANHLHSRVLAQYAELCHAVFREGPYWLGPEQKILEKEPVECASITPLERRNNLQKAELKPVAQGTSLTLHAEENGIQGCSVGKLKTVCSDTEGILLSEESISHHPGKRHTYGVFDNNELPIVTGVNSSQYQCAHRCEKYKHFDKHFCQHTLAVAEHCGELAEFLGTLNTATVFKSAAAVNAAINAACRGAGNKGPPPQENGATTNYLVK